MRLQAKVSDALFQICEVTIVWLAATNEDESRGRIERQIVSKAFHQLMLLLVRRDSTDEENVSPFILHFVHYLGIRRKVPLRRVNANRQDLRIFKTELMKLRRVEGRISHTIWKGLS